MKKYFHIFLFLPCFLLGQATWVQKANVPDNIGAAAGFAIGQHGYIGLGYNPGVTKKFYKYDTLANTWTQVASFPGATWGYAEGFSVNGNGYVTAGQGTNTAVMMDEVWEYSPTANTWTQKANFPGGGRTEASSFVIGNTAYLGLGSGASGRKKDLWAYNATTDTWTQKADCGSGKIWGAIGFAIGNKGYFATGSDTTNTFTKMLWEYDPALNTWTQKANFPGTGRVRAIAFSINGKGYVGCGDDVNAVNYSDFYEYDPVGNTWSTISSPGTLPRQNGVGFTILNSAYVGTGGDMGSPYYNDFWKLTVKPKSTVSISENNEDFICDFYPNPSTGLVHTYCSVNILSYKILDMTGKVLLSKVPAENNTIRISELPDGTYTVFIEDIDHHTSSKRITISH